MFNEHLTIFLTAMLPISELRGAVPLGLAVFKLEPVLVYLIAVLGNILPVFFLLWFWENLARHLGSRWIFFNRIWQWLFARTRQKFYAKHRRWGEWALVVFVAVPLPATGAWTGSLAAWLFGIPYKRAVGLIFLGVLISGIIVTLLTSGILSFS